LADGESDANGNDFIDRREIKTRGGEREDISVVK
jgi:hypothetical protein